MFRKMQFFLYLLMVMLLGACSNEAVSTKPSLDTASVAEQPSDTGARTHSTHRGKPGADVRLQENVVHRLEPGVEAEVMLNLTAAYDEGTLTVNLNGSDGLYILGGVTSYTFPLNRAGEYNLPLRLLAADPGRYYVNLHVSVDQQGRQMTRVLAAIIQVGEEDRPGNARQKGAEPGGVVPLPAQETIIHR